MSKEGYNVDKKESDNKIVLERLQSYLKDKRSCDTSEESLGYNKPSTSYENPPNPIPNIEDGSTILREVLNYKKAALLRDPDIIQLLKSVSDNLKQKK